MEVPESDTMFSALFNGPPAEFTAKLYVDPTVTNFTVSVRSTETDILITHVSTGDYGSSILVNNL